MSIKIRLARAGAKKRPFYRIVVADSRSPRDGRFIERIGSYNPMVTQDHPDRVKIDADRARHWLSVGARPTDRVARFLANAGLMAERPRPEQTKQHQPRAKAQARTKTAQAGSGSAPAEAAG